MSLLKKCFLATCWAALLATAPLLAAPINPDVSEMSGSVPHLDAGAGAWVSFDSNQGAPTKGGLVVVYTPTDPGDFNAFPVNAGAASVTLRPTGAGATLNCSITAVEPSLSAATAGKCFFRANFDRIHVYYVGQLGIAQNLRVTINGLQPAAGLGVFQAFDSDSILPAKPQAVAGRIPARLGLVLDRSGSMAWSSHPLDLASDGVTPCNGFGVPPPGCGPTRWEVLGRGVEALLTIADAYLLPGDQVTVAPFDHVVAPQAIPLAPLDHTAVTSIRNLVKTPGGVLSPGGATSIGAGLVYVEPSVPPVDPTVRNQYVLLFTDGDQNTAPYVVFNDDQVRINDTQNDPVSGGPLHDWAADGNDQTADAKLCPFALRSDSPSSPLGTEFNGKIATRRCLGHALTTVSVDPAQPELIQYFLEILDATLIGDKLELAAVRSGLATQAAGWIEESFIVSRRDVAFTVLLAWVERQNGIGRAWLEKDGVFFPFDATQINGRISSGSGVSAITLRAPYCFKGRCVDPEGEWKLGFVPFFEVGKTFTYNVFVNNDNALIATRFGATQPQPGVGEPLVIEAVLEEGGKPIEGLPKGRVRAVIKRPKLGLGNVLGPAKVRPLPSQEGDQIGPAGLKAAAMLRDKTLRDRLLAALLNADVQVLPLIEEEPGIYRAKYTDTVAEGAYGLELLVDGKTAENGRFTRTFTFTPYVPVFPDAESTWATATVKSIPCPPATAGGKPLKVCFEITLTPIDRARNLLGPGKATLFSIPPKTGQMLAPVVDHLDGSYTLKIGFPKGGMPPVIAIGGNPLPQSGKAAKGTGY